MTTTDFIDLSNEDTSFTDLTNTEGTNVTLKYEDDNLNCFCVGAMILNDVVLVRSDYGTNLSNNFIDL